jgi:hypothetical protein
MGSFFWLTNCDAVRRRKLSVGVAASLKEGYSVAWIFGLTVGDHAACAARHRRPLNQTCSVAFKKLNSGNTPKRVVTRDHGGGRLILNAKARSE